VLIKARTAVKYRVCSLGVTAALTLTVSGILAAGPSRAVGSVTTIPILLNAVSSQSASEAWAVGSQDTHTALVLRWNGARWTKVASPNPGGASGTTSLFDVRAVSPASAWAVGLYQRVGAVAHTLVLRWNGSTWKQMPSPNPGAQGGMLIGVSATSASNAWAVGDYIDQTGAPKTLTLHWDGTRWTRVSSPNPGPGFAGLSAVSIVSRSDAWAVGFFDLVGLTQRTLLLHWNGTAWKPAIYPGCDGVLSDVSASSASNAWAVGNCSTDPVALHWNGTSWTRITVPAPAGARNSLLFGVSSLSASQAWAVGYYNTPAIIQQTLVLHWDGSRWMQVPSPNPGGQNNSALVDVSARSSSDAWAVGNIDSAHASELTLVLHWDGTSWSQA